MEESCKLCNGLRGHARLRESLRVPFREELVKAKKEYKRLSVLFEEICWYNFEVSCKTWEPPWYTSVLDTQVTLYSHIYEHTRNNGHVYETSDFPVYFDGTVRDATLVPPGIILNELNDAAGYVLECELNLQGVDTWAPGGMDYEDLKDRNAHMWS